MDPFVIFFGFLRFEDPSPLFQFATDLIDVDEWITVQKECLSFLVLFMASLNSFLLYSLCDALLEFLFEVRRFPASFGAILLAVGTGLTFLLLIGALLPGRCSSWLGSFRVCSRPFCRTAELQCSEFMPD